MWPSFTVGLLELVLITSLNAQPWFERSRSGLDYFVSSSSSLLTQCAGAVQICKEKSAILATANNDEDKTYLNSITSSSSDSFFIGLHKPAGQSPPVTWRDGSVYSGAASDWKSGSVPYFAFETCYCTVQNKDNTNSWSTATCASATATHPYVCQRDADVCSLNLCQNGATCFKNLTNELFGYNCECGDGWSGTTCGNDIDECDSVVCLNGATCLNTPGSYSCSCVAGYTGQYCETEIVECESIICLNNATCQDLVNGYRCNCLDGFEGDLCGTEINECDSSPCLNNGICQDAFNNFTCECLPGFKGELCSIDINECDSFPCLNQATCLSQVNSFICYCASGFEGDRCATVVTTDASATDEVSMTAKTSSSTLANRRTQTTPNQGTRPPNVEASPSPNTASTAHVCHMLLIVFSLAVLFLLTWL